MIDDYLRRPWPENVVDAARQFKQGDLIENPPFFYGVVPGSRVWGLGDEDEEADDPVQEGSQVDELHPEDSPKFGIITAQTCDVAEQGAPTRPWIQVSPVYALQGTVEEQGKMLRRGYIVELTSRDLPEGRWAADLRIEFPLEKTMLVGREPISGFASEDDADHFAEVLGHRRGRPALATTLVENVTRLIGRKKSNNERRAAPVWAELYGLRLQIEEGTKLEPRAVRLHVISREEPSELVMEWFNEWWDGARERAEKVGITLLATGHHDARSMDVVFADGLIDLGIT